MGKNIVKAAERVALAEGIRIEGYVVGANEKFVALRNARSDFLVPKTHSLQRLAERVPNVARIWVRIHFVSKVALGGGRTLWEVNVAVASRVPHGARGALRRSGRRVLKQMNTLRWVAS